MRLSRLLAAAVVTAALVVPGLVLSQGGKESGAGVTLKMMKYDELGQFIRSNKGKVILVDFWADYCTSCKREFPHLVEMHKKYAKDGFVAVSVTLDDPTDAKAQANALNYLKKQQAEFTNVALNETAEYWQKKLQVDGPPCIYVFNRKNQFVLKRDGVAPPQGAGLVDYAQFEKKVVELLAEKE